MLSRAAERVGLEWRKPQCPEPSRLDDWFLGVACAGSQRPAPGTSLPDVHEELTSRGRHLLLPETDLLTPPPSPPSVVQLGVYGGPPGGAVSCDASVCLYCLHPAGQPCLLFRACRYSSGLIRRGLCGLWSCLHLTLRRYCRFFRLKALRDMHGGGHDPEVLKELRTAPDLAPRATKVMARSLGRAMSTLVVQECHLWLCLVDIGTPTKFGSSRFLYPRLASSATQPVTWPSSSRLHRSRLRRSNTSCLSGQLLPPPVRRLQRPACSSPRAAPCIHPRTASAAAFKSGVIELGVGRPPSTTQTERELLRERVSASLPPPEEGRVDNLLFQKSRQEAVVSVSGSQEGMESHGRINFGPHSSSLSPAGSSGRFESVIKGYSRTLCQIMEAGKRAPHTQTPPRSATGQVPAFHLAALPRVHRWSRWSRLYGVWVPAQPSRRLLRTI